MEGSEGRSGRKITASKRSSMACTTCRQVKLRCDANNRFPAPCTRCEKQCLTCKFDPKFRRQRVRGSLQKVMEENERLRNLVQASSIVPPEASIDPTLPTGSDTPYQSIVRQTASPPINQSWSTATAQEIEGVHLEGTVIEELFDHFSLHCLRHLPILDLQKPIDSIRNESPLLFWTVIVISVRTHPLHSAQFESLQAPFRRLLSGYLVNSIRSIYTIQALLLLCLWPFPVAKQPEDPSWDYCGMAVAATFKMGLDDSQSSWTDASEPPGDDAMWRLKTWLGSFVVSTTLSADLALPPPMGSVATMVTGIRDRVQADLLEEFLIQLEIAGYSTRAAAILNNHGSCSFQKSLIELFEHELGTVEARMPKTVSLTIQLDILAARLRLYALPLLSQMSCKAENKRPDPLEKSVWYKGFHTAIRLTKIFADSAQQEGSRSTDESNMVTTHYPKHYFRMLVMAGMYFINFLAIDREVPAHDRSLACIHIKKVNEVLLHWSRHDRDEVVRAARVIELLASHVEAQYPLLHLDEKPHAKPPTSIITNGMRMVGKLRSKQNMSIQQQRPESSQTWMTDLESLPSDPDLIPWAIGDDLSEWNTWLADGIIS